MGTKQSESIKREVANYSAKIDVYVQSAVEPVNSMKHARNIIWILQMRKLKLLYFH